MKILVIDDEKAIVESIQEILEEQKHEVTTASVIVMTASQKIPTSILPLQILRKPIELDYLLKMVEETGHP